MSAVYSIDTATAEGRQAVIDALGRLGAPRTAVEAKAAQMERDGAARPLTAILADLDPAFVAACKAAGRRLGR